MEDVIKLLKEKNQFLEKFFRLNEAELLNLSEGKFDNLETFYNSRDGILDMINRLDEMIENTGAPNPADKINDKQKKVALEEISFKNDIVTRILSQDLQILSCIERAKSEIIRELSQVRSAKKAVGAYKSGNKVNRLDEEW